MWREKPQLGNLIFQGTAPIRKGCFPAIKRTVALNWILAVLLTWNGSAFLPATSAQVTTPQAPPGPDRAQPSLSTTPRIPGGWPPGIRTKLFVPSWWITTASQLWGKFIPTAIHRSTMLGKINDPVWVQACLMQNAQDIMCISSERSKAKNKLQ